jgi:NO-binding membrane sensor protein with MHYT domain
VNHSAELVSIYSLPLIILSFVIAACASYCALELVVNVSTARGHMRRLWLWAGAATFGLGTWAMHFVGMLAFDLSMPIGYHLPTVVLSMLPVMGAAALAISLAANDHLSKTRLVIGAVLLGSGIGGMHYSGMLSMRMEATTYYDPKFLLISVLFAVVASLFALHSTFIARDEYSYAGDRFVSAGVMGGAITGLHFTAMINASHFTPVDRALPGGSFISPFTTAAPSGAFIVQIPASAAVVIALIMFAIISVVLRQARRAVSARATRPVFAPAVTTGSAGH